MKLNISNLNAILQSLSGHIQALATKDAVHQPAVDSLTEAANQLDGQIVQIIQAPDPGPRTDLDFSQLDAAVNVFKQNKTISQQDADNVAGLITRNTPQ
jgi:hypothetical protein